MSLLSKIFATAVAVSRNFAISLKNYSEVFYSFSLFVLNIKTKTDSPGYSPGAFPLVFDKVKDTKHKRCVFMEGIIHLYPSKVVYGKSKSPHDHFLFV